MKFNHEGRQEALLEVILNNPARQNMNLTMSANKYTITKRKSKEMDRKMDPGD